MAGTLLATKNPLLLSADEYHSRLRGDEPCFELAEINVVTNTPGAGHRRIQVIRVIRNDQIVTFRKDMGLASAFKTEEFAIPGAVRMGNGRWDVLETVERMVNTAEEWRAHQDKPAQRQEPINFVKEFEAMAEGRRDARRGRKRFAMRSAK